MTPADFRIGDTFYLRSRVGLAIPHLHVLITAPQGTPPTAIVVHVTTYQEDTCEDATVILQIGDHPFIEHPSYVWFAQATRIELEPLMKAIGGGYAEQRERCSPGLLKRIREGFLRSDEPSRRLKRELVTAIQAETALREPVEKADEPNP